MKMLEEGKGGAAKTPTPAPHTQTVLNPSTVTGLVLIPAQILVLIPAVTSWGLDLCPNFGSNPSSLDLGPNFGSNPSSHKLGLDPCKMSGPNPRSHKLGLDLCTKFGSDPSIHTHVLVLILAQRLVLIPMQSQVWSWSDGTRQFTNRRDIFKVAKVVYGSRSDARPFILLLQLNQQTPTSLPCLEHTHTYTQTLTHTHTHQHKHT